MCPLGEFQTINQWIMKKLKMNTQVPIRCPMNKFDLRSHFDKLGFMGDSNNKCFLLWQNFLFTWYLLKVWEPRSELYVKIDSYVISGRMIDNSVFFIIIIIIIPSMLAQNMQVSTLKWAKSVNISIFILFRWHTTKSCNHHKSPQHGYYVNYPNSLSI